VVISELNSALDIIDKIAKKRKKSNEQKNMDKVLTAIYKLGDNGGQSVNSSTLQEQAGFTKQEILNAIKAAKEEDFIVDCVSDDSLYDWLLNPNGCFYVESLLEEK
jgi:hypothetical protein